MYRSSQTDRYMDEVHQESEGDTHQIIIIDSETSLRVGNVCDAHTLRLGRCLDIQS